MDNWLAESTEKALEPTTIVALDSVCDKYIEMRAKENELKIELKKIQEEKDSYESAIVETLKRHNKKEWAHAKGSFGVSTRIGVRVPSDPNKKEMFFNYLKERDLFESMVTVNSQTLNAFYKQELAIAESNKQSDFSIPGIEESSGVNVLSFRKK